MLCSGVPVRFWFRLEPVFGSISALIPVTVLFVSKLIIDSIVAVMQGKHIADTNIWWLVGAEFLLAAAGTVIGRAIDYCDGRIADRFSRT